MAIGKRLISLKKYNYCTTNVFIKQGHDQHLFWVNIFLQTILTNFKMLNDAKNVYLF
jgi:hypothetical protein